jgi:hypothetical protein
VSEHSRQSSETQPSPGEIVPHVVTDHRHCDFGRDSAGPRACSVDHKWPDDVGAEKKPKAYPRPMGGALEYAGAVLRLVGIAGLGPKGRQRKRDKIREWSRASRRRLLRTCLALDWNALGRLVMITLTYPGERGAACIPHDGRTVHKHLRRFLKRWARQWGTPRGLWKLEFQRRGAPHLHLFLSAPNEISMGTLRPWVADAWWRVVGSGDADHLRAGTGVEAWNGTPTRYAWKYAKADSRKEPQHQVPDDFQNVGRWWGLIKLAPRWITNDMTAREFVKARRVLRRWRRATSGYRLRLMNSTAGFWLFTRQENVRGLVDAVMRAVTEGGDYGKARALSSTV